MTTGVLGNSTTTQPDDRPWVVTGNAFGSRLAMVRWRMGWNIKEAALACKLPAASWRDWELAGSMPRRYIDVCSTVAEVTGADRDWLIDGRVDQERVSACYGPLATSDTRSAVRTANQRPPTYPLSGARNDAHRRPQLLRRVTE